MDTLRLLICSELCENAGTRSTVHFMSSLVYGGHKLRLSLTSLKDTLMHETGFIGFVGHFLDGCCHAVYWHLGVLMVTYTGV